MGGRCLKAYNTYRSVVFTLTTAATFFFWSEISKIMPEKIWLGVLLSGIVSLGTYRIILKVVELLLLEFKCVKSVIFGSTYLEGIWVGCFVGHDGKPQYYIESFEQDFDGLVIRGKNFYADKRFKGTWISDRVIIDDDEGKITYTYITDMIYNTHKNQGLAEFNFDRENKKKLPKRMLGFSSDIFNTKKFLSVEEKILDRGPLSESDLLDRAIDIYEKNRDIFSGSTMLTADGGTNKL